MNIASTLIVHPVNLEQENVLKAFFEAFKIRFEVTKQNPYNEDFVNMVLQAEDNIKQGKGKKVTSEEFDNLWK
ncbi:MAG: hypothetical protein LBU83_13735 [Bacteroidales bacterium]|jgi:hypothetical protein|nr:hypothetical protein [Bacteroidales bacterium]